MSSGLYVLEVHRGQYTVSIIIHIKTQETGLNMLWVAFSTSPEGVIMPLI